MDPDDVEQIQQLKYRYLRSLDLKLWSEYESTLTPDATAVFGDRLSFASRDEIVTYMRGALGPGVITTHHCHHPEIMVDGDRGTGIWGLDDTVIVPEYRILIRGSAFYEDRYRRGDDGRWGIEHTGYRRTYEYSVNLADVPSFTLTANLWAAPVAPVAE